MEFVKRILLHLIVFQTFNDNLMVDLFGENVLKFTLGLFLVVNIGAFFSFRYLERGNASFSLFLVVSFLSWALNFNNYLEQSSPLITLISILGYYVIFSVIRLHREVIFSILAALIVSSLYCIFRDESIAELTLRKTGGTGDPNEFSATVLLGIGAILGLYFEGRIRLLFTMLVFSIFVVALLMAASKSAFVVLVVVMLYILRNTFLSRRFLERKKVFYRFLIGIVLLLVVVSVNFIDTIRFFFERFETNDTGFDRLRTWEAGYVVFSDNILFGVGPNNFSNMINRFFLGSIDKGAREAHNVFIKVIVETGIFGSVPFFVLIFSKLRLMITSKELKTQGFMLLGPLLMGLSLSLTFEKYFWIALAMISPNLISTVNEKKKNNTSHTSA